MSWRVRNLVKSKVLGKTINPQGKACSAVMRKLVLEAYADVAAHDGTNVFISKTTIAAEAEVHRSSVVTATQSLLDDGLLVIDDSKFEGGRRPGAEGFTYVYRIVISALMALPDTIPGKCRNSDTLDDRTVDGDEVAGMYLKAVSKSRKVSATSTLKVSESGRQSVDVADMNYPSRTKQTRTYASVHRRADPEFARDEPSPQRAIGDEVLKLDRELTTLRRHLATAGRGEEIASGEYAGILPKIAAGRIASAIKDIEARIAAKGSAR